MCVHINIRKYKSRTKILEFVEQYNNSLPATSSGRRPLGKMLRQQHVHLIEHLLEIYHLEIKKNRAMGLGPEWGQELPSFRTNCVQLAKRMNCSERTIRGLRARLRDAKVIEAECFHGSNSSFEVWLNRDLLFMASPETKNENAAEFFSTPTGRPALRQLQSLPHTVTSKTSLVTNQLKKLSGALSQPSADNQSVTGSKDVENPQINGENTEKQVDKPHSEVKTGYKGLVTGPASEKPEQAPPVAAAPPKKAPESLSEVLEGLDRREALAIDRQVNRLYGLACQLIYSGWWIADTEAERTRARLAEYLRYSPVHLRKEGANQLAERMALVARYVENNYPDGFRFPLPSAYFDIRNGGKVNFRNTKQWYWEHKAKQYEIKNSEILTKAINEYLRSMEEGAKIGPAETYRRINQRLSKRDKNLLKKFHQQLASHEQPESKS